MTTTAVQVYKSTDASAPVLTGQVGKIKTLLDAVLVDGYATAAITSITRGGAGNLTATATLTGANTTLATNDNVVITGCTGTGNAQYNITAQITVTDSTHFTYQMASDPGANASGSPVYAKAPAGWARPFAAGTNSQTYRAASGNRFYLQTIDNAATAGGAKEAQVYAAEVMSGDQAVTSGQYPTVAQLANGACWRKSTTADATARPWTIVASSTWFYMVPNSDASVTLGHGLYGFGDFPSFKAGDGYNSALIGWGTFNSTSPTLANAGASMAINPTNGVAVVGLYVARGYAQTGGSIAAAALDVTVGTTSTAVLGAITAKNIPYPNGPDGALWQAPIFVGELISGAYHVRGRLPGLYTHMHNTLPINEYDTSTNVVGLSGITLLGVTVASASTQGLALIDAFGPW